jgi:hypothetical protein
MDQSIIDPSFPQPNVTLFTSSSGEPYCVFLIPSTAYFNNRNNPRTMAPQLTGYKRTLFTAIIVVAVGVVLTTILKGDLRAIGTVFIAVGGLLFILAMRRKQA